MPPVAHKTARSMTDDASMTTPTTGPWAPPRLVCAKSSTSGSTSSAPTMINPLCRCRNESKGLPRATLSSTPLSSPLRHARWRPVKCARSAGPDDTQRAADVDD
jgi:hypothetical protein